MVTPKRPLATCLMAERLESPLARGIKRLASSPPSPVLDFPPNRFIATANDSCASALIEPKLMAPVAKRLTISAAASTSLKSMPESLGANSSRPRNVALRVFSSLTCLAKAQYASSLLARAADCRLAMDCGSHKWISPVRRQWKSPGLGSTVTVLAVRFGKPS